MVDDPNKQDAATEPAAQAEPPPQNGNGKEPDTISDRVQRAREIIPVGDRGPTPSTYAQWVDIAKDVCKAYLMLPKHLHDNPPVVAGLLEIAARFQLSPYMLASQTYIQNDRLCFQAQAFGALLYASKLLLGRLHFEFRGEGEDMTCTVSGRFKDDPDTICVATTPPLKLIHPGHVQKDGKTFVKGSPLWDKDAEQQEAYFGERRWIRRFAPDVCMGMYTKEEMAELDDYRADRAGAIPLTSDRLGQLETGEGWREGGHVHVDLAAIEAPEDGEWPAEVEPGLAPRQEASKPARPGRRKPVQRPKTTGRATKPSPSQKARPGRPDRSGRHRSQPPTRAEVKAAVKRAEHPPRRVIAQPPRWLNYVARADAWIGSVTDPDKAERQWDKERDERDDLQVPMGERSRLRAILDRKIAQLQPKKENEQ
jgi:hypothetical protein